MREGGHREYRLDFNKYYAQDAIIRNRDFLEEPFFL
jgi:hypothetical protein